MSVRKFVWIGAILGTTLGQVVASLWGATMFSFSSIILSVLLGILGVWIAFRIYRGY